MFGVAIGERKMLGLLVLALTMHVQAQECPPDFTLVGGSCFLHVTHMATWSGARDLCRDMGAELVTVRTKEEQVNLIDYLRSPDLKSTDINVKAVSAQKGYVPFNRIIEKFLKGSVRKGFIPFNRIIETFPHFSRNKASMALFWYHWIGATDLYDPGHWLWDLSNGFVPVQRAPAFWKPRQPNHKGCLAMQAGKMGYEYKWKSYDCEKKRPFICEVKV